MSVALFTLCYLENGVRMERHKQWLSHMFKIKDEVGFDEVVMVSNADSLGDLTELGVTVCDERGNLLALGTTYPWVTTYVFDEFLPRLAIHQYPYLYRGILFQQHLIRTHAYEKVIFLDTDFYILTSKFAKQIKDVQSGWVTYWCHKYNFPEETIMVLCPDAYGRFLSFPIPSYTYYNKEPLEELFHPLHTEVRRTGYKGDRYGETQEAQTPDMDYYAQHNTYNCPKMIFNMSV